MDLEQNDHFQVNDTPFQYKTLDRKDRELRQKLYTYGRGSKSRKHVSGINYIFTITTDKSNITGDDFNKIINYWTNDRKNIAYAFIGAGQQSPETHNYHYHVGIKFNRPNEIQKIPTLKDDSGLHEFRCHFVDRSEQTIFTQTTNKWPAYVEYVLNHSPEHQMLHTYDPNHLMEDDQQLKPEDFKRNYKEDLTKAAEMDSYTDALTYMRKFHADKAITNGFTKNFRQMWESNHPTPPRPLIDEELKAPWLEDDITVKRIKGLLYKALQLNQNDRPRLVVIVGPSQYGKTEFIREYLTKRDIPYFYQKGDFTLNHFDETINYKLYIFEDINFLKPRTNFREMKSLVNDRIDIDTATFDVKFGDKQIPVKPTFVVLNNNTAKAFLKGLYNSESYDYWNKNIIYLEVKHYLYDKEEADRKLKEYNRKRFGSKKSEQKEDEQEEEPFDFEPPELNDSDSEEDKKKPSNPNKTETKPKKQAKNYAYKIDQSYNKFVINGSTDFTHWLKYLTKDIMKDEYCNLFRDLLDYLNKYKANFKQRDLQHGYKIIQNYYDSLAIEHQDQILGEELTTLINSI